MNFEPIEDDGDVLCAVMLSRELNCLYERKAALSLPQ